MMLFIEIGNLEFPGGHIKNYAIYRHRQIRINGGHIGIMLFIEM